MKNIEHIYIYIHINLSLGRFTLLTNLTVHAEPGAGKALRTIAGDIGEGVHASSRGRVGRSVFFVGLSNVLI